MKILMLAPQPCFEPRGTPFSVLGRLRALSELGHEVDLLTYHLGPDALIPKVSIHRIPHIRFIKSIKVGPSLIKVLLDVLLTLKAIRLLRNRRYDLIHSHEEISFVGVLLARVFNVRHLYDMHSSLPQQLSNFEYTRSRLLIKLFEWLEGKSIKLSDAIITICPALEEYVLKINSHVPHMMIENVATEGDPIRVSEDDMTKFKSVHSLDGKTIVLYAGTFERYQGIDLLLASADLILRERSDILFVLVGGNPDQVQYYQRWVKERGLTAGIRLIGRRPPQEIPAALRLSHVLVSPRVNGTNTPLKIYSYLQACKPIVATNICTHTQVLNSNAAVLVQPEPKAMAQGILSVCNDTNLARRLGIQSRRLFESRYSHQGFLDKTDQVLRMAFEVNRHVRN